MPSLDTRILVHHQRAGNAERYGRLANLSDPPRRAGVGRPPRDVLKVHMRDHARPDAAMVGQRTARSSRRMHRRSQARPPIAASCEMSSREASCRWALALGDPWGTRPTDHAHCPHGSSRARAVAVHRDHCRVRDLAIHSSFPRTSGLTQETVPQATRDRICVGREGYAANGAAILAPVRGQESGMGRALPTALHTIWTKSARVHM
jgi:hypothetical protein